MQMNKTFIILSFLAIIFTSFFKLENAHAIPADCNWDSTVNKCCNGQILNCSFEDGNMNLWCGGTQVPIGVPCAF